MRHKLKGRKLNRTSSHRKALLINLASALLKHELIKTTLPKAKELRPFVEKIMTIAKVDSLANRRRVLSVIKDHDLVNKLFSDIATRIKDRKGGYTRIMHYGFRVGDKAPMSIIELVDRVVVKEPIDGKKVKSTKAVAKTMTKDKKPKEKILNQAASSSVVKKTVAKEHKAKEDLEQQKSKKEVESDK
jgi:large subunit ribosomal protein L17